MRARGIREGSVGLLLLVGVGLFGALVLWLRGLNLGSRSYTMTISFENTAGMLVGTAVRYRGVAVGRVIAIRPGSNMIDVVAEIAKSDLRIPEDALVEANQSGFIGETTVDITPRTELTDSELAINPTGADCDSSIIVCDGDRLDGRIGISYESLLRSTEALADTLGDPELVDDLKTTLKNTAAFTERATVLAGELTELTVEAREQFGPLTASVQAATTNASAAAQEIELTATEARSLLVANQTNLNNTLGNIARGSDRLVFITDTLAGRLEDGQLLDNLEILSANAAEASANLNVASVDFREITAAVNQPENLLLVQQTLESARSVFQSAQKILSDVDQLTGDPVVREQIRELLNGLTDLLSDAETLEQQVQLASALEPLWVPANPETAAETADSPAVKILKEAAPEAGAAPQKPAKGRRKALVTDAGGPRNPAAEREDN